MLSYIILFASSLLGFAVVGYFLRGILAVKVTDAQASKVADAIRLGAMTFLKEEYRVISLVVLVLALAIAFLGNSYLAAACFVCGSFFSLATGFIGMRAATAANVRTTLAARDSGTQSIFNCLFWWWCDGFCRCQLRTIGHHRSHVLFL